MNLIERYKTQKQTETPYRLQSSNMNINNDTVDNYIISRINIRESIEQDKQEQNIRQMIEKIIENTFNNSITERMIYHTKSINNNKDKQYIRQYIENMRSQNSYLYRKYINENSPGVNFELNINIPESDGGGSFKTFLKLGNDVFLNI